MNKKVTLLAGGIGGAKLAEAYEKMTTVDLTVVPNVGDDDEFHGLWVSPDVDTITYTLSDRVNREFGWGVKNESLNALNTLKELGEEAWMTLGDKDLGLHIYRTHQLKLGKLKSEITEKIAKAFGIKSKILLATDDTLQTQIKTDKGLMSFQEYFVKNRCEPNVLDLLFFNSENTHINLKVIAAIETADLIIIAPSNPLLSILPILKVNGMREILQKFKEKVCVVSPIIDGKAIKGPTIKIMNSMGYDSTSLGIAKFYESLASKIVCDTSDENLKEEIQKHIPNVFFTPTLMKTLEDKIRLAEEIIESMIQI
jgi:LPPG:FO 2-phospho-L-lactate transferase